MSLLVDGYWLPSHRADPRALALYRRHYSARKNAPYRRRRSLNFVSAGSPMVLLTAGCDAVFVWLKNTAERYDHQTGICCTLFRNESAVLSSDLVREADALAWARWPGERHFTYVDPAALKSTNPGFCFLAAGWRRCGTNKDGRLVVLERPGGADDTTQEASA